MGEIGQGIGQIKGGILSIVWIVSTHFSFLVFIGLVFLIFYLLLLITLCSFFNSLRFLSLSFIFAICN